MFVLLFQFTLGGPLDNTSDIASLKATKRFKLIESIYRDFQKSLWPEKIYPRMTEYLTDLNTWSKTNDQLKTTSNYQEIQEYIANCLQLIKELSTDPENCEKQLALIVENGKLKTLFNTLENEKLQGLWLAKYAEFILHLRSDLKNASEKFYTSLKNQVNAYIQNLNDFEKTEEIDIIYWYEKFNKASNNIRKYILTIQFMGQFPHERQLLEAKCKIQFSNRL